MNKKSVAVITYHKHDNYGAILQCYALQEILKREGMTPCVIDYLCKADQHPLSLQAIKRRGLKACIKSSLGFCLRIPRHSKFEEFRKKLSLTQAVDEKNIEILGDKYDFYIAGSDNVWNADITGLDKNYFLDFVNDKSKRKTYAASFGGASVNRSLEAQYRKLLNGIDTFLMREKEGAMLVEKLTGRQADLVLDPTLLLTAEEWDKQICAPLEKGKYIFVYQLAPSKEFIKQVRDLSETTGCRLVFTSIPIGGIAKGKIRISAGPKEWLSLLKNAEYVFTDSFHACVFSIIFHKRFFCHITQLGTRITHLLGMLGLEDCIVNDGDGFPHISESPDYAKIDMVISDGRRESINRLKAMLSAETYGGGVYNTPLICVLACDAVLIDSMRGGQAA